MFSQLTGFLAKVKTRLDHESIGYCYLDGRTRRRDRVLRRFRDGDDPVFLISLKAGGFGLNLAEADYVFQLDPWWNPATEAQAIDRTHRIGPSRQVMVYRLIGANTIEQKVVALAARPAPSAQPAAGSTAGAPQATSGSGSRTEPSSCWPFSSSAMIVRPTATAVPFRVWGVAGRPASGR